LALEKARRELARRNWVFIGYQDKSTLILERVKEAGAEVWAAFQSARQGRIFFKVFPDHFGARDKAFKPMMPARIGEIFMDRVIEDAGGRRLCAEENEPGARSADYLLGRFIFELKDLQEEGLEKGGHQSRLAALFRRYYPRRQEVPIDRSVLTKPDYHEYLDIMSRPVKTHLRSASKQVKATRNHLCRPDLLGGLIMLNTGFGTFPHKVFAEQVERYATKDSRQFVAVISASVWACTNGFDSWVYYEISPRKTQHKEVAAIQEAFGKRFELVMTRAITDEMPDSEGKVVPAKPIAFERGGIDFAWMPPTIPVPWARGKEVR
jgi:hypothetical protein